MGGQRIIEETFRLCLPPTFVTLCRSVAGLNGVLALAFTPFMCPRPVFARFHQDFRKREKFRWSLQETARKLGHQDCEKGCVPNVFVSLFSALQLFMPDWVLPICFSLSF